MSIRSFTFMAAMRHAIVAIFLFVAALCEATSAETSMEFLEHLAEMQSDGLKPDAPDELLERYKSDFVRALDFGAELSNLVPLVDHHVKVLDAMEFLLMHLEPQDRMMHADLQAALTRVALYPGPYYRIRQACELLGCLYVLDDATTSFLMDEAASERQHLALWRVIAKHFESNSELRRFYKEVFCSNEPEHAAPGARIALRDIEVPDCELLECVLNDLERSVTTRVSYLLEHADVCSDMRGRLRDQLENIALSTDAQDVMRQQAYSSLRRNFEADVVLRVTEGILREPSNPDLLLRAAIGRLKRLGIHSIPDVGEILERIRDEGGEESRKEAALALEELEKLE